jgi:hypothetical protein
MRIGSWAFPFEKNYQHNRIVWKAFINTNSLGMTQDLLRQDLWE